MNPARRSRPGLDAIVVGGGAVGAALTLGLLRAGRRVALIEAREPAPWGIEAPDLRVYAMAPDNLALLAGLGAAPDPHLQPYVRMRVRDAGGGGELAFDAASLGLRALGAIVENARLVDALWRALRGESALRLHCPARVVAFEQDDRSAALELDDGSRLAAPLVVAADGADSALRELAGIAVRRHDYGQRGVVGFVESEQPHEATAWQRFLTGGPLAVLPFFDAPGCAPAGRGRRSSIVWTLPDAEAGRVLALDDEAFGEVLSRAFDRRLGVMRPLSPRVGFPLRRQLAADYRAGRIVLAGDAAHAVHPLAGQGVNLGLRDVRELLAVLDGVDLAGEALPHRLARYARRRRSEDGLAAWTFDGINRLFSTDAPLPTLLRGPALGLAGRIAPLRDALARRALGG